MATFLEQLQGIQAHPLLEGLVLKGKAQMLQNQDQKIMDIVNNFNEQSKLLDSGLSTTQEQLGKVNNDGAISDLTKSVSDQAAQFQAQLQDYYGKMAKYNSLYGDTITQLSSMDNPEARQLAETFGVRQSGKMEELEQQASIPLEKMKYEKFQYDIAASQLDAQKTKLEIEKYQQDQTVMSTAAKIGSSTRFQEMTRKLILNGNNGDLSYNLPAIREEAFKAFGNEPEFSKAWLYLEDRIRSNTKTINPPVFAPSSGTPSTAVGQAALTMQEYGYLRSVTEFVGKYNNSPDGFYVRDAYQKSKAELEAAGRKFTDKDNNFGANEEVINNMKGDEKSIATQMHNYLYNVKQDQNGNTENYWVHFKRFKSLALGGNKEELRPFDKDASTGQFRKAIRNFILPDGSIFPANMGDILNNEGGYYYNPADPETMKTYQTKAIEIDRAHKIKEGKKGVNLNPSKPSIYNFKG